MMHLALKERIGIFFRDDTATFVSVVFLGMIGVIAAAGPYLPLMSAGQVNLGARLIPPAFLGGDIAHVLGTDPLGRDNLSRIVEGIVLSVRIAVASAVIAAVMGTSMGLIACACGGRTRAAIMTLVDVQASLPFMILALAALAFFGNSLTLFTLILGLYGWERYTRLAHNAALSISRSDFVTASRHFGAGTLYVYVRHILPNVATPLIVNLTIIVPEIIILESGLSFLGLGVQPPEMSLGSLLGSGRDYLQSAWWIAFFPGLVIALISISVAVLGDRIRASSRPALAR